MLHRLSYSLLRLHKGLMIGVRRVGFRCVEFRSCLACAVDFCILDLGVLVVLGLSKALNSKL